MKIFYIILITLLVTVHEGRAEESALPQISKDEIPNPLNPGATTPDPFPAGAQPPENTKSAPPPLNPFQIIVEQEQQKRSTKKQYWRSNEPEPTQKNQSENGDKEPDIATSETDQKNTTEEIKVDNTANNENDDNSKKEEIAASDDTEKAEEVVDQKDESTKEEKAALAKRTFLNNIESAKREVPALKPPQRLWSLD